MTGLCLIAGAICALYFTVKWIYGAGVARLSILPPVLLFSFTTAYDFVHYSSEHFPIFLTTVPLAAAAYLARGTGSKTSRLIACATAGLSLGCPVLAKLQAAPIALAVLISLVAGIFITPARSSNTRKLEVFVAAAGLVAIPSLVLISLCATGGFENAVISYYKMTLVFTRGRPPVARSFFFFCVQEYTFLLGGLPRGHCGRRSSYLFESYLHSNLSLGIALLNPFVAGLALCHLPRSSRIRSLSALLDYSRELLRRKRAWPHAPDRSGGKGHAVLARSLFVALFLAPIGFTALTSASDFSPQARAPMRGRY